MKLSIMLKQARPAALTVLWAFVLVLALSPFFFPSPLFAQEAATIQGKVTDVRTGEPLYGASVYIKELGLGAATDRNGMYSFLVPGAQVRGQEVVLTVSFIGYRAKTEKITLRPGVFTRDFTLSEDVLGLEEVVVTGVVGGTFKERLPFTVDRVTSMEIQHVPARTVETAIRGKVPGVAIIQASGQPGTAATLRLRGPTSISTAGRGTGPLMIVDGIILAGGTVDMDALNVDNIEVVKGAAASGLYGSRAASGVVQITTNRAAHLPEGETRITFRNEYGQNSLVNKISLSKRHQFRYNPARVDSPWVNYAGVPVPRHLRVNDTLWRVGPQGPVGAAFTTFKDKPYVGKLYDQIDEFFDPGFYYTNTLNIAHRSRATNFLASFSNRRESGVVDGHDGYWNRALRLNVDHRFLEGLEVSLSGFHSSAFRDDLGGNTFFALTFMPPDVDLRQPNADGQPFIIHPDPGQSLEENPLYAVHFAQFDQRRKRTMGNLTLRWAPLRWLSLDGNLSYDRLDENYSAYFPKGYKTVNATPYTEVGELSKSNSASEALNGGWTASIEHTFGDLSTRTKLRYAFESTHSRSEYGLGRRFAVYDVPSQGALIDRTALASSRTEIKSEGFFFITGLDYQGKYIGDFLVRRDGSSLFGADERWQTYYRGSLAYRMAQEPWWFWDGINEFKLRYSIGTAGNRPSFAAQYETFSVVGGTVSKATLGNKKLKPELSTEQEVGLEVALFDRFMLDVTYAKTVTTDQILQVPLVGYYGFSSQWQNAGTLESNTIEASLKAFIIQKRDFSWSATLLFDRTRQRITEFNLPAYRTGPGNAFYMRKGEPLGTFYGIRWMRNHNDLPPYLQNTRDQWQVNDDGYLVPVGTGNSWRDGITKRLWGTRVTMTGTDGKEYSFAWGMPPNIVGWNDFMELGRALPDFNMAFNTTLRWRGLTFYALFDAQIGGKIYNQTRQWAYRDHMSGDIDQIGKTDETKKPLAYYSALYHANFVNSHFVEDGTYVKFRELSVRYTFDGATLARFMGDWVKRITVGVIGRNLMTWTNFRGYDPEVGGGEDATIYRFDGYQYPNYRTITGKIEIEF